MPSALKKRTLGSLSKRRDSVSMPAGERGGQSEPVPPRELQKKKEGESRIVRAGGK